MNRFEKPKRTGERGRDRWIRGRREEGRGGIRGNGEVVSVVSIVTQLNTVMREYNHN